MKKKHWVIVLLLSFAVILLLSMIKATNPADETEDKDEKHQTGITEFLPESVADSQEVQSEKQPSMQHESLEQKNEDSQTGGNESENVSPREPGAESSIELPFLPYEKQ